MLNHTVEIIKEYRYFKQLVRQLTGPLKIAVFRINPKNEKHKEIMNEHLLNKLSDSNPVLRYYPNNERFDVKVDRSFSLPINLGSNNFQ